MNEDMSKCEVIYMVKSAATRLQPRLDERTPKQVAFKKLAESRLAKALAAIEMLENLASSSYQSSAEAREFIVENLQAAVDSVESVYKNGKPGRKTIEIPD